MITKYVGRCNGKYKTTLRNPAGEPVTRLIWGDPVHIGDKNARPDYMRARGFNGVVDENELVSEGVLEIYVIDVGQGDSILFRTPDGAWHLIDGGVRNAQQMTKKGAANFLRWKFQDDLGQQKVTLANVFLSHPDSDHFGGLVDVFTGKLYDGRTFPVEIQNYYHNGLPKYEQTPIYGPTTPGTVAAFPNVGFGTKRKGSFISGLLDGKASFQNPPQAFEPSFKEFTDLLPLVTGTVARLSMQDGYVPGYGVGENQVTIKVLGPIVEAFDGNSGLRYLGNDSWTVNGHSLMLLVEYGQARILLAGDLNALSQKLLLSYQVANEFKAEVAKACHHGSEDIYPGFLKAVQSRATVISSGDAEDFAHPRPAILGACGMYGRPSKGVEGEVLPPLVYSTELARSVKLGFAKKVLVRDDPAAPEVFDPVKPKDVKMSAGDWKKARDLPEVPISTDLVYGLINVRTDGQEILCGVMRESGTDFDIKVFQAGVDV